MIKPDPALEPDWDVDNTQHIAAHGLSPEQVEEVYYGEGPFRTLAVKNKKGTREYRYRLWGCDASGKFIEVIIAPYPEHGVWRCVTAFPMTPATRKAYLRRLKQ